MPRAVRDFRFALLAAALVALCVALARPSWTLPRPAYDLLLVVDVTGSMNARDYMLDGNPAARLDAVKKTLRDLIARLPCRSRVGLGIFTERRSFLLFEPVELCDNYSVVDAAIASLEWRMAWEGDSRIASGLNSAMEIARSLDADLVFLTDGHEAPPLPASGAPPFEGEPGKVGGLIVGIGGGSLVPIPKFDDMGREIGFFAMADVPQENRLGLPPADASSRPGWHPRNAPFGGEAPRGNEHLTSLRGEYLQTLARRIELGYVRLQDARQLEAALAENASRRMIETAVDLSPIPAAIALAALVACYGALPLSRLVGPQRGTSHISHKNERTTS
ncbi:VWA domain-containing protein [Phyllobacterium phragmitis]|uniref:VWA domain-containing protein n=2 Tax=Phyllobacterium phragmitis TaxID=2670329 RepID=A0A2S9IL90_9HYPH|nr:VWA domain-containing protein [Phyllobacterium phragmitis]